VSNVRQDDGGAIGITLHRLDCHDNASFICITPVRDFYMSTNRDVLSDLIAQKFDFIGTT
jgi:hypothetical protein